MEVATEVVRCWFLPYAPSTTDVPNTDCRGRENAATIKRQCGVIRLFTWITEKLACVHHYDTVYVFVDNRELPDVSCPAHWPYFAHGSKADARRRKDYCHLCPNKPRDRPRACALHLGWHFRPKALCTDTFGLDAATCGDLIFGHNGRGQLK